MDITGSRVKILRKAKNMTYKELSALTGLSIGFLGDIEKGRSSPSIKKLVEIAKALDTTTDYLSGRSDNPHPEQVSFDYSIIFQQRDEGDAYLVVRQLEKKYNLSKDTVFKMIDDIAKFYENQQQTNLEGGRLADGPKSPGSGVFSEDDDGDSDS